MTGWTWTACGKHPTAKDYFRICEKTAVAAGIADWIERGYESLLRQGSLHASLPLSWRLWVPGPDKQSLLCGIIKDSSDSIGRPYPLMILGMGQLAGWQANWHLLPFACERTWNRMETISARSHRDLKHLEEDVGRIQPPEPEWRSLEQSGRPAVASGASDPGDAPGFSVQPAIDALSKEGELFLLIRENPHADCFTLMQLWHSLIKKNTADIPKAVFMGGNAMSTVLAVFRRPLQTQDFVRIWTSCS